MFLRKRTRLALLAGLIFALTGCALLPATAEPAVNPTVVIVQYVTQVVATVTPAPPTAVVTPVPPTQPAPVSGGYDPFSVEPYYPLTGCPVASRLHVGDVAFVATGGEVYGIHYSRNVGFAPIARKLTPGETLFIIGDPTCNRNGLVWEVLADADDTRGFVLEGNGESYWVLPYGQTFDLKEMRDRLKEIQLP